VTLPPNERRSWDYTLHFLTADNKVMEVQGSRVCTEDELHAYANSLAAKYECRVLRQYMKETDADDKRLKSDKARVRQVSQAPAPPALPAPVSAPPQTITLLVTKHFQKVARKRYSIPKTLVHTSQKEA
jgi:hypothetical protein